MNFFKLDLFYYAGTPHYCLSCHTSLPDLVDIRKGDILSMPLNGLERKQYLSIRNAAGIETKR